CLPANFQSASHHLSRLGFFTYGTASFQWSAGISNRGNDRVVYNSDTLVSGRRSTDHNVQLSPQRRKKCEASDQTKGDRRGIRTCSGRNDACGWRTAELDGPTYLA